MKNTFIFCLCMICASFAFAQKNYTITGEATAAISISNCSVEHDENIPGLTFSPVYNVGVGLRKKYSDKRSIELLVNGYYVNYKHLTGNNFTFPSQYESGNLTPAKEYNFADMVYLGPTIAWHFDRKSFSWFTSAGVHAAVYTRSNYFYYSEGEKIDESLNQEFDVRPPLRAQAKLGVLLGNASSSLPQMKIYYAFDFVPKYENSVLKSTFSSLGVGVYF